MFVVCVHGEFVIHAATGSDTVLGSDDATVGVEV
jgi:hypothetical protein